MFLEVARSVCSNDVFNRCQKRPVIYPVSSLYLTEDIKKDCELSSMVLRRESGEVFLWIQALPFREAIKISRIVVGSSKGNARSRLVRCRP